MANEKVNQHGMGYKGKETSNTDLKERERKRENVMLGTRNELVEVMREGRER